MAMFQCQTCFAYQYVADFTIGVDEYFLIDVFLSGCQHFYIAFALAGGLNIFSKERDIFANKIFPWTAKQITGFLIKKNQFSLIIFQYRRLSERIENRLAYRNFSKHELTILSRK